VYDIESPFNNINVLDHPQKSKVIVLKSAAAGDVSNEAIGATLGLGIHIHT
jgi:hypothetical protein